MLLTEVDDDQRFELVQKLFAFMDSHPIDLNDEPESAEILQDQQEKGDEVSELSKAKFASSANSEDLQEMIKQKSRTINAAVAMSEEK